MLDDCAITTQCMMLGKTATEVESSGKCEVATRALLMTEYDGEIFFPGLVQFLSCLTALPFTYSPHTVAPLPPKRVLWPCFMLSTVPCFLLFAVPLSLPLVTFFKVMQFRKLFQLQYMLVSVASCNKSS